MIDIIIPAATNAKRMKGRGARSNIKLPTGETILQRQINIFNKYFGDYNLHLILGFDFKKSSSKIRKYHPSINILHNKDYDTSNINKSIKLAIPYTNNPILILHGDLVFTYSIFDKIKFNRSKVFIEKEKLAHNSKIGCIYNNNDELQHIGWNVPNKWCQIVYITEKELNIFKSMNLNDRGFSYEIIKDIINMGGKFLVEKIIGGLVDIDTIRDIKTVTKIV